jgi:mutator protein MutT
MKKQIDVTAAIIVKDNKVFAARRRAGLHLGGCWEFPGGKLEAEETPEQCLNRELEEEFKITTRVGAFFGESVYDYGSKVVRLLAYQVEHLDGEFLLTDHDALCWLSLNELDSVQWAPADIPLVQQYKSMTITEAFYTDNAQAYCAETIAFDMEDSYQLFLDQLSNGAHILDLGCGSGRDSKAFLEKGYEVTPIDGNAKIAACAEQYLECSVAVITFQTLDYHNTFNGVWSSASLLHCPRLQLPDVLKRIALALCDNGVAYFSFKWGEVDSVDERGRHFTNFTEDRLVGLLGAVPDFTMINVWSETKPLRDGKQRWVNGLVKRQAR